MAVYFYDSVADGLLCFAVIIAKYNGKLLFCKHRARDTLELPGGHREPGEAIEAAARRELQEETGAIDFTLRPICVYSVEEPGNFNGRETFGMLYLADIETFAPVLHMEIEQIFLLDGPPEHWTYPTIQPLLMQEAEMRSFL